MAMQTQGVVIGVASTTVSTQNSSVMDVQSTVIVSAAATCAFDVQGFTSDMYISWDTSTNLRKVKSVAATAIAVHGTMTVAGPSQKEITGWTFNQIGEVTDFTGPGGAAAVIDITNILSTAKQKLMGLRDEGQFSMTLNYNATDTGQGKLINYRANRQSAKYRILLTDATAGTTEFPSWMFFNGYCLQYSVAGAVDNKITANAVIEIDGPVIISTKTTSG